MSLLYSFLEFTYAPKTRMYFFSSPFVLMGLGWALIYAEIKILNFDAQQAAINTFFPIIIYFFVWVLFMMLIRTKYYPKNGQLVKIDYLPAKDVAKILPDTARKEGFAVSVGKNTYLTYAEAKITGTIDGTDFLIERSRDPSSRGAGLNSFVTGIYINTKNKGDFSINSNDIDSEIDLIANTLKKNIIMNCKQNLIWLFKETGSVGVVDFKNGSMGATVSNDVAIAPHLRQTLEALIKIVKTYDES